MSGSAGSKQTPSVIFALTSDKADNHQTICVWSIPLTALNDTSTGNETYEHVDTILRTSRWIDVGSQIRNQSLNDQQKVLFEKWMRIWLKGIRVDVNSVRARTIIVRADIANGSAQVSPKKTSPRVRMGSGDKKEKDMEPISISDDDELPVGRRLRARAEKKDGKEKIKNIAKRRTKEKEQDKDEEVVEETDDEQNEPVKKTSRSTGKKKEVNSGRMTKINEERKKDKEAKQIQDAVTAAVAEHTKQLQIDADNKAKAISVSHQNLLKEKEKELNRLREELNNAQSQKNKEKQQEDNEKKEAERKKEKEEKEKPEKKGDEEKQKRKKRHSKKKKQKSRRRVDDSGSNSSGSSSSDEDSSSDNNTPKQRRSHKKHRKYRIQSTALPLQLGDVSVHGMGSDIRTAMFYNSLLAGCNSIGR